MIRRKIILRNMYQKFHPAFSKMSLGMLYITDDFLNKMYCIQYGIGQY